MKVFRNMSIAGGILIFLCLVSCTSTDNSRKKLAGKYAAAGESGADQYKDTLEVRLLSNGNFEVQTIAHWSAAKKDDSTRTDANKKAGVWNSYGPDRSEVAFLQSGDTTLRITDQLTGEVKRIAIRSQGKTLERTYRGGVKKVYHKTS